jgi:hypothetical protein
MSCPFKIAPKHWYHWLNPFWWRRKRLLQAVVDYEWESNNMEEKITKALTDAVLYGEGYMNLIREDLNAKRTHTPSQN